MSTYRFRAANVDGVLCDGLIPADDTAQATAELIARGLAPVSLVLAPPDVTQARSAGRRELAILFQSLSSLVDAGVPLERALLASADLTSGRLKSAATQVHRDLREGRSLGAALARTNGVIPPVVVGMVSAGERGSQLSHALRQVAGQLEAEADLVAGLRSALAYPVVLAVAGTVSVTVIATVVVPRFAAILGELGTALPPATRLLLGLASLVQQFGLWMLLAVLAVAFGFGAWIQQPAGRSWLHGFLLQLPLVGPIRHTLATTRVCRALGATLASGMPLLAAIESAQVAAGDSALETRLAATRERVARGEPLTASLRVEHALVSMALQLLAVGEATGQVGAMASKAGDLAAQESARRLRALAAVLEPALVIGFGAMVAFVAAALLQAVYSIRVAP